MDASQRTWVILYLVIIPVIVVIIIVTAVAITVTIVIVKLRCDLPRITRVTAEVDIVRTRAFLVFYI